MARATVVGIVGGVASGKTTVAAMFAALGARLVDADALGKAALGEPGVRRALAEAFGPGILRADGAVDHARLADAAFGPPPRTGDLNRIVHPFVLEALEAEAAGGGVVVFDASLLLESGAAPRCDLVVFVEAEASRRRARAGGRGWAAGEWERREGAQETLGAKRRASHVEIVNNGAFDETEAQVRRVWAERIVPTAGSGTGAAEDAC